MRGNGNAIAEGRVARSRCYPTAGSERRLHSQPAHKRKTWPRIGASDDGTKPRHRFEEAPRRPLRDALFKAALRVKFVRRALSYIGTPYHRKYFPELPPGTLFLDCCGLIRRVVKDLAFDFGFELGRWNQAYQLDTLPIELSRSQLIPGDLIFWRGKLFDPKRRPFRLDCVHVEIYLGSQEECYKTLGIDLSELSGVLGGNATLGSRSGDYVRVHTTYEDKPSKHYEVTGILFRSLETWLKGVHRGQKFKWTRESVKPRQVEPAEDVAPVPKGLQVSSTCKHPFVSHASFGDPEGEGEGEGEVTSDEIATGDGDRQADF